MKKLLSILLSVILLFSVAGVQATAVNAATKTYATDKLAEIQKKTGYIPGKTAVVTGNCYQFVSKVCEKLYGVKYDGEGLYGNYRSHHNSGNYYTVKTYEVSAGKYEKNIDNLINFFIENAYAGDIIHYGTLTSGTANTGTHTVMINSIDTKKMTVYQANYQTVSNPSTSCHVDTIYWDSLRENPTKNIYTSSGDVYSLNGLFYNKIKGVGLGVTINRYKDYGDLFYEIGAATPILTAQRDTSTSTKLSWTEVTSATKYQLQYRKSNETSFTTLTKTTTKTSYTIKDLPTGSTYYYRVRAYAGTKWMPYCDEIKKKVLTPVVKVIKFANDETGTNISWAKRSDVSGVRIYRAKSADGTYSMIKKIAKPDACSYIDTTAKYNTKYYYKVERYYIYNGKEYPTLSDAKAYTYKLKAPKITPLRINTTSIQYTFDGDPASTQYTYYVKDSSNKTIVNSTTIFDDTIVIEGLTTGEAYTLSVACKNSKGKSDYSTSTVLAAPTRAKITATGLASSGIKIQYRIQDDVDGYYIYRSESPNGPFKSIAAISDAKKAYYIDKSIEYGKKYYYKVAAFKGKTTGVYSFATDGVAYTLSTPKISVKRRTPTSVTVSWGNVKNASQYRVYYKLKGAESWTRLGDFTGNSVIISKLSTGDYYKFKVKAKNSIGFSNQSTKVTVRIMPQKPATPTASIVKNKGIKIKWTPKSVVTGVKVYRATSADGKYSLVKTINSNKTSSWTDTTVKKSRKYYYKIAYFKTKSKVNYTGSKSDYVYIKY